jgi:hypothetical protein
MTMKSVKLALLGLTAAGALAATAAPASADVACNRWGECWRVRDRYDYPPNLGVVVRPDAWWDARPHGHWRWRHDRDDRGYWSHGRWHRF